MKFILILSLFFSSFVLAADKTAGGIRWQKKGMEKALEIAKKENKPMFVYWGAVWCPPCNIVKSQIFSDAKFIAATRPYVAVYLDGDSPSAQEWGEKLKASGYPTLMILNPDGKEVVRLSTSQTAEALTESLQATFNNLKPVRDLVDELLKTPDAKTIQNTQWQIVANYGWDQDETVKGEEQGVSRKLLELADRAPAEMKVEKAKIILSAIGLRLSGLDEKTKLSSSERKKISGLLTTIASDTETYHKNLPTLVWSLDSYTEHVFGDNKKDKEAFLKLLAEKGAEIRKDHKLIWSERLLSYYPEVQTFAKKNKDQFDVSADLQRTIAKEIDTMIENVKNPQARIALMSDAADLLFVSNQAQAAKDMLNKELKRAKNDYYVMSSLSYFEEKEGNIKAAIEWSRKAYQKSEGVATRLQWGASYANKLMKLAPEEKTAVLKTLEEIYKKEIQMADAFLGRNKKALERIAKNLKEWSQKQKAEKEVADLRKKYEGQCSTPAPGRTDLYKTACTKYFSTLGI